MSVISEKLLAEYRAVIGQPVTVTMDRPIGTAHPKHPEVIYPINYGYAEGIIGGDGEEQDVYVLGETQPLDMFSGVIVAVVHRYDDNECKWVACKQGKVYSVKQIEDAIQFQEQFHKSEVITR